MSDNGEKINHPLHYNLNPSGVGYLWRAGQKDDLLIDLRKAQWYVDREIARISKETT